MGYYNSRGTFYTQWKLEGGIVEEGQDVLTIPQV